MNRSNSVNRKAFLKKLGLGLFGVSTMGLKMRNPKDDCGYTDSATSGPFYVRGTEESVNLNFTKLPGKPMKLFGNIFGDEDGKTKVPNAKIEVWHCDNAGVYHPEGNGNIGKYSQSEIALRGFVISDASGEFSFHSITPGLYGGRRRHIHYRITAKGYQTLTTQSYWLSEKGNDREQVDGVDRNTEECRYIDFEEHDGISTGRFDIYLKRI